jgi:hypothetical protein
MTRQRKESGTQRGIVLLSLLTNGNDILPHQCILKTYSSCVESRKPTVDQKTFSKAWSRSIHGRHPINVSTIPILQLLRNLHAFRALQLLGYQEYIFAGGVIGQNHHEM